MCRLTILKDGDETCEQVIKCIGPDVSASGDFDEEEKDEGLEPVQASGDNNGNLLETIHVLESTKVAVHGNSHEEDVSVSCTQAQ